MKKSFYCFCTVCTFFLLSLLYISCSHDVQEQTKNDGTIIIQNDTNTSLYVHYSAENQYAGGTNAVLSSQVLQTENILLKAGEKTEINFKMGIYNNNPVLSPGFFVSTDKNKWYWEIYDEEFFYQMKINISIKNNDDSNKPFVQYLVPDEYEGFEPLHAGEDPDGKIIIKNETELHFFAGLLNFDKNNKMSALTKRIKLDPNQEIELEYYLSDFTKKDIDRTSVSYLCLDKNFETVYTDIKLNKIPVKITITEEEIKYSYE